MSLELPNDVSGSQDLSALILELRGYHKWYSHESIKQNVGKTTVGTPPPLSPSTLTIVKSLESGKQLDLPHIEAKITELENFKRTAKTITITLAGHPSANLRLALTNWCRTNLDSNILVNFQVNSTILGGMVVRYGSRIFDWSFKRQILGNISIFPEVLRRVR